MIFSDFYKKFKEGNVTEEKEMILYNKEHVGDVLMVIAADDQGAKLAAERKMLRVFTANNGLNSGLEHFELSDLFEIANADKFS